MTKIGFTYKCNENLQEILHIYKTTGQDELHYVCGLNDNIFQQCKRTGKPFKNDKNLQLGYWNGT